MLKSRRIIKIVIFSVFYIFSGSSFGETPKSFYEKIESLIDERFSFRTDVEEQQFCPDWNSKNEKKALKVRQYENYEDYEQDFNVYKERVLKTINKLGQEKCKIVAFSDLVGEKLTIRDFSFSHFPENHEELNQNDKKWGKIKIGHLSHGENYNLTDETSGLSYKFNSFGAKGAYFETKYHESSKSYYEFNNSLALKKINRYGVVGREVEGGDLFYDFKFSYLRDFPWKINRYHIFGGLGLKIDQDSFIKKELEPQRFTLERLTTLSLGPVFSKDFILLNRVFETKIFFYYKMLAEKPTNVNVEGHQALSTGIGTKFFPSKYMNYFIGLKGKYSYSQFTYYWLSSDTKVETYRELVSLNLIIGMAF